MSSTNVEYAEGIYLDDGTLKKFKDADLTKQVEELNSNTTVKTTSITGRTDSNGLLYSEFKTTDTMVLYAIAQDCVVIPVAVGGGTWAFHFSTFGNVHMTEHDLTCAVYYYRAN